MAKTVHLDEHCSCRCPLSIVLKVHSRQIGNKIIRKTKRAETGNEIQEIYLPGVQVSEQEKNAVVYPVIGRHGLEWQMSECNECRLLRKK